MGNCNIEKGQPKYANYSKDQIEEHCIAMIKKDHFIKREPVLKNQALEDVQKIIDASMDLIRSKEQQMIADYSKEIKRISKD